jgi:hypothetical protein
VTARGATIRIVSEQPRDPATGRFVASSELSTLQLEALDRLFSERLRQAALGAKPSVPALWSLARTSKPAPAGGFDWGGGSRLPSTSTRGDFDAAIRKTAAELGWAREMRVGK